MEEAPSSKEYWVWLWRWENCIFGGVNRPLKVRKRGRVATLKTCLANTLRLSYNSLFYEIPEGMLLDYKQFLYSLFSQPAMSLLSPASRTRLGVWIMAALYILAGVNHFIHPETYLRIMPPWLPEPALLVILSGIAEILLGIGLLWTKTRRVAAWGIILLLVAVFPANIQMALNWHRTGHPHEWIAWARLPLQGVLIWWAWRYTRSGQSLPE
jgi:uncharacterized membrane protein